MLGSNIRWILKSRSRAIGCCACLATTVALLLFWTDLCAWRADICLQNRQLAPAIRWVGLSQLFRSTPNSESCLLQLRIARRQQNFRKVEELLQQANRLGVPHRELRRERLLATVQTHQFSRMEGQWAELLNDPRDDGPEIARAYYTWAMLHHYPALAKQTLNLWQADYPNDAEPLYLKGCYFQAHEDWEGAEAAYQDAYAMKSDNDEYRLCLAYALQQRLKSAEAILLYEESLRHHPENLTALRGLAECEATKGHLESAIQIAKRAFEINSNDFATQKVYGELLLASGAPQKSAEILGQAYRVFPEHANLANSLARALKESGHNAEAEPLFAFVAESRVSLEILQNLEQKLQHQPDNLKLRMEIASVTAKYVSRQDAIRWYENILLIAPDFHPARAAVAELYRAVGDEDRARMRAGEETSGLATSDSTSGSGDQSVPSIAKDSPPK